MKNYSFNIKKYVFVTKEFRCCNFPSLSDELNDFLVKISDKELVDIKYSCSGEYSRALVVYKDYVEVYQADDIPF